VSGFVVSLMAGFIAVAGLVFDGSRLLAAHAALEDHAGNAARAAAQEVIDVRRDQERIDPREGARNAHDYLSTHGLTGDVVIHEMWVRVSLRDEVPMTLLALIGVSARTVSVVREVEMIDE